jgi:hypothetical protein
LGSPTKPNGLPRSFAGSTPITTEHWKRPRFRFNIARYWTARLDAAGWTRVVLCGSTRSPGPPQVTTMTMTTIEIAAETIDVARTDGPMTGGAKGTVAAIFAEVAASGADPADPVGKPVPDRKAAPAHLEARVGEEVQVAANFHSAAAPAVRDSAAASADLAERNSVAAPRDVAAKKVHFAVVPDGAVVTTTRSAADPSAVGPSAGPSMAALASLDAAKAVHLGAAGGAGAVEIETRGAKAVAGEGGIETGTLATRIEATPVPKRPRRRWFRDSATTRATQCP